MWEESNELGDTARALWTRFYDYLEEEAWRREKRISVFRDIAESSLVGSFYLHKWVTVLLNVSRFFLPWEGIYFFTPIVGCLFCPPAMSQSLLDRCRGIAAAAVPPSCHLPIKECLNLFTVSYSLPWPTSKPFPHVLFF